jgi:hypothetical protein
MTAHEEDFPKTTVSEFLSALLVCLVPPGIVIFLVVKLVLAIQATHI